MWGGTPLPTSRLRRRRKRDLVGTVPREQKNKKGHDAPTSWQRHKNRLPFWIRCAFPQKNKGKKEVWKTNMSSSVSCAQHHQHQQLSFRGRVGKTSSSASSSCSTSFASSLSRGGGRKATLKCFASGAISKPWDVQKPCKLVLEDGSVWQGKAFGADGTKVGEVVFNTSLSGYVYFSLLLSLLLSFTLSVCCRRAFVSSSSCDVWTEREIGRPSKQRSNLLLIKNKTKYLKNFLEYCWQYHHLLCLLNSSFLIFIFEQQ